MMPRLIGLSGYAQTGKDTVGQLLVQGWDFQRVAFADALRDMLYALNPIAWVDSQLGDYETVQEIVDAVGWDRAKVEVPEIRALLQRLGTEAGRNVLGEQVWVEAAHRKVQAAQFAGHSVVITDVRFPNEYAAIKRGGGQVWRIQRPGIQQANAHPSETALDGCQFDVVVHNDGSYDDLARTVAGILEGS